MRTLFLSLLAMIVVLSMGSCKSSSSSSAKTFCDTTCQADTLRFVGDGKWAPYVYIAPNNCGPGKITRSYKGMGASLTSSFPFSSEIRLSKDHVRCVFNDTAAVYILFNNCLTGRGYQIRLPFNKTGDISQKASSINSIDPKFAVADNMVAYTDRGNIYVEEMSTGKTAMMTFGKGLDIDYDAIHEYIDSVNVTSDRIWVRVKIDEKWTDLEKKITLEDKKDK